MSLTTLIVNNTTDRNDGNLADGLSLREAIIIANAAPDTEYEIILTGGLTYNLTIDGIREDAAATGDLDILERSAPLSIRTSDGQKATIDGSSFLTGDRIIDVLTGGKLNLQNLIITGGFHTGSNRFEINGGGGIQANEGSIVNVSNSIFTNNATFAPSGGGAIYNRGSFTLSNSIVSNNLAEGRELGNNGGGIMNSEFGIFVAIDTVIQDNEALDGGGGIFNFETLTLINTTVSGNQGGGLESNYGSVSLLNTTVSSNQTGEDAAGIEAGGGTVNLFSSTVTANKTNETTSLGLAAGISNVGATVNLENSIVSGNVIGRNDRPSDLSSFNDSSIINGNNNNLVGELIDIIGNVGTGSDIIALDPLLSPLQDNGGFSLTHLPLAGSPAINAGNNSLIPFDGEDIDGDGDTGEKITLDQRGFARINDGTVDIGAVEFGGTAILPTISIDDRTVVEGSDSQAILTLKLSNPSSEPVTVDYTTNAVTATADSDYTSQQGTVTFAANATTATVSIPIIDNNTDESDETFNVTLTNPTNATIQKDTAIVTISSTPSGDSGGILDIDGSGGAPTFARDALLFSAYSFFYSPTRTDYSVLDKFILDRNATRTTGQAIASFLQDKLATLDIDGSGGAPTFARDALLFSAYSFFYSPTRTDYSVLDKFILDPNATRKTGQEIADYLEDFLGINAAGISSDPIAESKRDLVGTMDNDLLIGSFDGDFIYGGSGDDLLIGGLGANTFVIEENSDRDTITDFQVAEDLILIDPDLGFDDSEAVFSAIANLGMTDDKFIAELAIDTDNKIIIFSDNLLTVDNFSVATTIDLL